MYVVMGSAGGNTACVSVDTCNCLCIIRQASVKIGCYWLYPSACPEVATNHWHHSRSQRCPCSPTGFIWLHGAGTAMPSLLQHCTAVYRLVLCCSAIYMIKDFDAMYI